MKLLGLEFHGFKSFADSQEIRFHDGITAIVGPNGCGKSNISDALRWVLGEQRPSAIRGSRMEEAIFQGTERRKPIHRAEVTLQLSNADRRLPVPYTDVRISRTMFRGGEGEYRLNGTICRLRDIQDLCRDTGLGTNAYSIIESRMVDAILSERAEERRAMFEEAAGIGRYKERRRVTMRRLDEAEGDLARVDDLIGEVEKKVRSLARQRGRARRYFKLRERKLALELALARMEMERLRARKGEIEAELDQLVQARVSESVEQRSGEAEYEEIRTRVTDLDRERAEVGRRLMQTRDRLAERERARLLNEERERGARARLEQIQVEQAELRTHREHRAAQVERLRTELGRLRDERAQVRETLRSREVELAEAAERREALESAAAAAEEGQRSFREKRAALQARQEGARADAEELVRRTKEAERTLAELAEAREAASAEAKAAGEELEAARARADQAAAELEAAKARVADLQAEREDLRARQAGLTERLRATEARIGTLEPRTTGDEALNPAVREAVARATRLGIRGVLGQSVRTTSDLAEGVESFLGPYLEALLVEDGEAAARVRRWFLNEYAGPGGLVLLRLDRIPGAPGASLPSGIEAEADARGWVSHLLHAVRLDPEGSADGDGAFIGRRESVDGMGVVRLGQPYESAGLLARRAELEALQGRKTELERETDDLLGRLRSLDAEVGRQAEAVEGLEKSRREAGEGASRLGARAEGAKERVARLTREEGELRAILERLRSEHEATLRRAEEEAQALRELRPVEFEDVPSPEEVSRAREEWEHLREQVADLRLAETRAGAAVERSERDVQGEESALEAAGERLGRLAIEGESLESTADKCSREAESAARDLEALFEERTDLEQKTSELEERAETLRARASELEGQLRQVQRREREQSERRHALELELSGIEAELRRARERVEDEWGRPFDDLASEVEPAEGDREELAVELSEVAERVTRMEPVNMLAEQEYQEESERLEFLKDQRDDLVKARNDLRDTIRRINETASTELLETLEKIRENFQRTFLTLFEGGECNVWLEDPEDPLDSPIEISASPSGKRTQRIHMLSQGERALTALSLLFAIYLVKPSPFCLLDEVDAPLDESNVRRFVAMLEEFKKDVQFIVITHHPVTIEAADWVYGVTMEEPGVSKIVGVEFGEYPRGAVA